ncbi:MAG: hypothetical protein H7327_06325 [Herminiimonas sp.]|nr:hypothetical protein [Herminiimonas sp.]
MFNIIAGRFKEQDQATRALDALVDAGFAAERICSFYLNPPGQHNLYSVGGDRDESPGAHEAGTGIAAGAVTGGAVGAGVGMLGAPVFGPVGPAVGALVGAHVGGLIGSLTQMKEKGEQEDASADDSRGDVVDNELQQRESGLMVAVSTDSGSSQNDAVSVLRKLGAQDIEHAQGTIVNGDWEDFDPLLPPQLLGRDASAAG